MQFMERVEAGTDYYLNENFPVGAIFNKKDICTLSHDDFSILKKHATLSPLKRYRFCLHHSVDKAIQEMIIVFCRDTYTRPHRHPASKSESLHLISGELDIILFDDGGKVVKKIEMGEVGSGKNFIFRLDTNVWHMSIPRSEFVVFHEIYQGPFEKDYDVEFANWSPGDSDPEKIQKFFKTISI